ncbi:hypothetical protein R3P38DRAFT_3277380 [Favolaschia claudopus]|uniref:F-box domain-containing protein n=1 Tax=Favolaschia claudopus TaxID=2862362 RepID=A0AAW0ANY7_9AGAR
MRLAFQAFLTMNTEKIIHSEALVAPAHSILDLPNEILSEVFLHFIPAYPYPPPLLGLLSPTCLMLVCRRWQETALATRPLWRAILIKDDLVPFPPQMPVVALWTARSGVHALSICVEEIQQPFRWTSHLYDALDRDLPLLRSLHLGLGTDCESVETIDDAPLLRMVVVEDGVDLSRVLMPWTQITSLTLCGASETECIDVLGECLNLQECKLTVSPGISPCRYAVWLPHLTVLDLTSQRHMFLNHFDTPALRCLRVSTGYPSGIDLFQDLLERSQCPLEEIHIVNTLQIKEAYRHEFPAIRITFPDAVVD